MVILFLIFLVTLTRWSNYLFLFCCRFKDKNALSKRSLGDLYASDVASSKMEESNVKYEDVGKQKLFFSFTFIGSKAKNYDAFDLPHCITWVKICPFLSKNLLDKK